jgi:hypothetical protein
MAQDQMFEDKRVELPRQRDRHRELVGVPLVRRPAPTTRAAEVADDNVEDRGDRGGLNGQEVR